MQTIRRLYLYAMSGIALGVIAVGLTMLVEVALDGAGLLNGPTYDYAPSPRQQLSQAVAMLGVGIPVWGVHWLFAQRGRAAGRPGADAERGAPIRALYLTLVLAVTLIVFVLSAAEVLRAVLAEAFDAVPAYTFYDANASLARALVCAVVWLYHASVRRSDLRAGPVGGAAAWIPRLYLYGVALGSLGAALDAIGSLAAAAVDLNALQGDSWIRIYAIETGITVIAWGLVWFGHWRYAGAIRRADDWRGESERASLTRLAGFVATLALTASFTIGGLWGIVQGLLLPLLGAGDVYGPAGGPGDSSPIRLLLVPIVSTVPWALAWFMHARWLQREPAAAEPERARLQVRLTGHAISAVALAHAAIAIGWLLGFGIDVAFGGNRTDPTLGIPWRYELAQWLPAAVIGAAFWLRWWSGVATRRRADPGHEANAAVRRAFLYLTLAVAFISVLASATVVLYRLVGTFLGARLGGNAVSELSTPLGALVVAAAVLLYHGLLLRRDQALRAAESATVAAGTFAGVTPSDVTAVPSGSPHHRTFELVGPEGADLDAALAAARAALPGAVELVERMEPGS